MAKTENSVTENTEKHRLALRSWFVSYIKSFSSVTSEDAYSNRLVMIGWVAAIGFPFYYWMWTKVYPQSWESLDLRLVGVALAIPLLFAKKASRRLMDIYSWIAITYMAPFFFTYALLMNNGSSVYAQSLLIAVVALFLFEMWFAISSYVVGTVLAYLAFVWIEHYWIVPGPEVTVNIPIDLFAILLVSVSRLSRRIIDNERLKGVSTVLATLAHELRTPLVSVHASAKGLNRYTMKMIEFYKQHQNLAPRGSLIPAQKLNETSAAIERIMAEVQRMNLTLDIMLANAGRNQFKQHNRAKLAVAPAIKAVIERYPFETQAVRDIVSVDVKQDFTIEANDTLFDMVIVNLLKNGMRAVSRHGKGALTFIVDKVDGAGQIVVYDTGCGIAASQLPLIFKRFYTFPPSEGNGIGLAFCRETLAAWNATINCRSQLGEFAEFTIRFEPEAAH
ncbi:MAG: HAMP domain-containing histidine kinase [Burkholderiaceae bacterium]|nr:HAMP domain-containing histidine kinase [Burkholderiaceae bacterium]